MRLRAAESVVRSVALRVALVTVLLLGGCQDPSSDNEPTPSASRMPGSSATPTEPPYDAVADTPFAVPVPGRDEVKVFEATYGFGRTENRLTIYSPLKPSKKLVLVVPGPQPDADIAPPTVAWSRLLAVSGLNVVVADYQGTEHVDPGGSRALRAAIATAQAHFDRPAHGAISIVGFSAGGPYAVELLRGPTPIARAAFMYSRVEPTPPSAPRNADRYSLSSVLRRSEETKVLLAYGKRDEAPGIAAANRLFLRSPESDRVTIRHHPGGHAFELVPDDAESRSIVRAVVEFLAT